MGQKVNPIGFRLGLTKNWTSKWFADHRTYSTLLEQDVKLQRYIKKHLKHAGISRVEVERAAQKIRVTIFASRPGIIIGRKGEAADQLKADLQKLCKTEVTVNIKEVKRPEIDAQLISENIATQLERRIAFRRAIKRALASAMRAKLRATSARVKREETGLSICGVSAAW